MTQSYIEQIDEQIAALQGEIDKLRIAKDVIAKLDRRGGKTIELKANPPAQKKSTPITIRKIEGKYTTGEAKPKTKRGGYRPGVPGITEEYAKRCLAALAARNGLKTAEIIRELGLTEDHDKQRVYSVMNNLKTNGDVTKDDNMRFWLVDMNSHQAPAQLREEEPENA